MTHLFAAQTGLLPGEIVISFGDLHAYRNHFDQIKEQLQRQPDILPQLYIRPDVASIYDYQFEDFTLNNYNAAPNISAPIAI